MSLSPRDQRVETAKAEAVKERKREWERARDQEVSTDEFEQAREEMLVRFKGLVGEGPTVEDVMKYIDTKKQEG